MQPPAVGLAAPLAQKQKLENGRTKWIRAHPRAKKKRENGAPNFAGDWELQRILRLDVCRVTDHD
jgi:hypothetical protein